MVSIVLFRKKGLPNEIKYPIICNGIGKSWQNENGIAGR